MEDFKPLDVMHSSGDGCLRFLPMPGDKIIFHSMGGRRLPFRERVVFRLLGIDEAGFVHMKTQAKMYQPKKATNGKIVKKLRRKDEL